MMRVISLELSGVTQKLVAQRFMILGVTLASLALLCVVLVRWTWVWFAPPAELRSLLALQNPDSVDAAYRLFGEAPQNSSGIVSSGSGAIRLLGIIAATAGGSGYAVMQLEAKDGSNLVTLKTIALREGEELAPGIRLAKVETKQVILERDTLLEVLTWPDKKTLPGK